MLSDDMFSIDPVKIRDVKVLKTFVGGKACLRRGSRAVTQPDRDHHHGLEEKSFDAGEVTLNYAEGEDNGPPLVLLHGLGRRWQVFLPLIPSLSLRWHIYALDLRGHGKSGHVPRGYRGTQYSEDVIRFLRETVKEPAVLFGHSLGGMAAMWVAAHQPELVKAIILGDSMISGARLSRSPITRCSSGACAISQVKEARSKKLPEDWRRSS